METPQPIESRFKTYEQIVEDSYFKKRFEEAYYALMSKRRSRPQPPAGRRYKSDWYDAMDRARQDNITFFQENILSVLNKTSSLSSKTRGVIEHVGNIAIMETVKYYATLDEEISIANKAKEFQERGGLLGGLDPK